MITRAGVRRWWVEFHKPLPSVATKPDATTSEGTLEMKPTASGYADVNGINLYHEIGKMMSEDYDWSADIAKLPMPVLLVFADNDSISQKHIAEFFALLGGGVKEPGWLNTQLSKSRLAIVPGYSHYNFITSPEVSQIVGKFLADPLSDPPAGAAAASQAAPAPENRS
jgi:pimeloyl-ACP methyl ester carboxylesterase